MTYQKIVEYKYKLERPIILQDSIKYHCRFCNETKEKKDFSKKAHAVSEFLGNKSIITKYECDECNDGFSLFENEIGKLFHFYRANRGVRGKHKKICFKNNDVKYYVDYDEDNGKFAINISKSDKNMADYLTIKVDKIEQDGETYKIEWSNKTVINKRLVYCSLLKYILSIVPENKVSQLREVFDFLKNGCKAKKLPVIVIINKHFNRDYSISYYENNKIDTLPSKIGVIDAFNYTFVISLDYSQNLDGSIITELFNMNVLSSDLYTMAFYDYQKENEEIIQPEGIIGHLESIGINNQSKIKEK